MDSETKADMQQAVRDQLVDDEEMFKVECKIEEIAGDRTEAKSSEEVTDKRGEKEDEVKQEDDEIAADIIDTNDSTDQEKESDSLNQLHDFVLPLLTDGTIQDALANFYAGSQSPSTSEGQDDTQFIIEKLIKENNDKNVSRVKDAERKRKSRSEETPEETKNRLSRAREYKRSKKIDESDEAQKERLKRDAERKRESRANETIEESKIRREKAALHRKNYLKNESPEKAEARKKKDAERRRESLKKETEEKGRVRREENARRRREYLHNETPEKARIRKDRDAERRRKYLENESQEQKAYRREQDASRKREMRNSIPRRNASEEPMENMGATLDELLNGSAVSNNSFMNNSQQ